MVFALPDEVNRCCASRNGGKSMFSLFKESTETAQKAADADICSVNIVPLHHIPSDGPAGWTFPREVLDS
jgi:hypothetical protein